MKRLLPIVFIACMAANTVSIAQPAIADGTNLPAAGFTSTILSGPASVAPGAGGAAVTWNFSTVTMTNAGGYAVQDVSATPVSSSYPSGNYAVSVTPTGASALYSFYIVGAGDMKELANSATSTAPGVNYTPGPRKILKFPFNYLDTFTAFYASTSSSGNDFVQYDGYGTLILPWATYTNVVRVKTTYTSSVGYAYDWYTTSPLISVLTYSSLPNIYTGLNIATTGTQDIPTINEAVSISPNPASNEITVHVERTCLNNAIVSILDIAGRTVKQTPITGTETTIRMDGLHAGAYFYRLMNNRGCVATGKLIIH